MSVLFSIYKRERCEIKVSFLNSFNFAISFTQSCWLATLCLSVCVCVCECGFICSLLSRHDWQSTIWRFSYFGRFSSSVVVVVVDDWIADFFSWQLTRREQRRCSNFYLVAIHAQKHHFATHSVRKQTHKSPVRNSHLTVCQVLVGRKVWREENWFVWVKLKKLKKKKNLELSVDRLKRQHKLIAVFSLFQFSLVFFF